MHAWIITHNESISISDYFSGTVDSKPYRPTVHYAYHPCDAAVNSMHEILGKNYNPQTKHRILRDDIIDGVDELGVLLMGNEVGSLWYGSNLSIKQARAAAPYNNATTLQVVAPVIAGMLWAIENPDQGILEADELPYDKMIDICKPYLGTMVSAWTDWTPLQERNTLFEEDIDSTDPWQFKNFIV
jgi:homospermidine synthase